MGYRGAKALFVAVELGIFDALEESDGRLVSVARRVEASRNRVEIIMNALAALGFLEKTDAGKYHNNEFSRDWLTSNGSHSLVDNIRCQEFLSGAYADFVETVRRGRLKRDLGDLLEEKPKFVRHYIHGMAEISKGVSRDLAKVIDASGAKDMLDVGGGPGLFALAFLGANPKLRAVVLDLSETLIHTRRYVRASPHRDRVAFQVGDYNKVDFGRNCFDLILMSHVTHAESAENNQRLVRKAHRALREGGRLVIHDFMVNMNKTGPLFPALFSMHMATFTNDGKTYSGAEYRNWFQGAGFRVSEPILISPGRANSSTAIIGTKR